MKEESIQMETNKFKMDITQQHRKFAKIRMQSEKVNKY